MPKSTSSSTTATLTVSYICHRQSSSVMFPRAALIPPCTTSLEDFRDINPKVTCLCSNSVGSCGEELCYTGSVESSFCKTKRCSETGTTSTTVSRRKGGERTSGEDGSSDGTYTTMASNSCSMIGYFPDDHDYICKTRQLAPTEEKKRKSAYVDFLSLQRIGCLRTTRNSRRV